MRDGRNCRIGFALKLSGLLLVAVSATECNQNGSDPSSVVLQTVDAGEDITTNTAVTLNGKVNVAEKLTTVWSSTSTSVVFGDKNSLTSSVTANADGTFVVTLTGTSAANVVSSDELTLVWDTTSPLAPVLNRASGSKFSGTLSLAVVNEKATDFKDYRYATDSETLTSCGSGHSTAGEFSMTSDQDIKVMIAACDETGNMSGVTEATFVFESESGNGTMYTVTGTGSNVTLTPSAAQQVASGETLTINVAAGSGYAVSNTVGGDCPAGSWNGTQYTTGAITADCSLSFTASAASLTVTASGQVNSYEGAPAFSLTVTDNSPGPASAGQTKSFTVTKPTEWHELSNTVNGTCPTGSWTGNVYTTGALTENCTVQFAAGTGLSVTFDEIKTLLGTNPVNSSVATSSAVANTPNTNACINCHKAPESTSNKPSGGFAITATAKATVDACGDNACRVALISYAKVVDNIKYDTKLVGATTSGSAVVTLATTTGLTSSNGVTGTGIPGSTTISSVDSATQITLSNAATATGRVQLTFTGIGGLLQESPVYCATSSNCTTTVYERVDPGSPLTSLLCLKVRASVTSGSVNALDLSSLSTGGVTLASTNTTPRTNAMPSGGPNYLAAADQFKICRWILQGANNL
jgi:hypothetical protein